ncbi:MAG: glycosyltransferase family 4 protein [Chitinophagaceae bacterium]|nr:glycosyltransferase family 4 protein [Chitinophagaceae bacterium]
MKILLVHTHYQIRGGEDAVFEQEYKLLKEGNDVETLIYKNHSGIKGLLQFLFSVWNLTATQKLIFRIKKFRPSVIHIHNWHFASGPAIIRGAKKFNIPVVLTLHNYRLLCPSASLMNGEKIFLDSVHQPFPWTAVKKGLYRNSVIQTFWLALVVWFHKKIGTWKNVDRFIVLTRFAQTLFLDSSLGITAKQLIVKPNFVLAPILENKRIRSGFLFAGRLTEEKGIKVLLEAFSKTNIQLKIAGEGPLLEFVKEATHKNPNIQYMGKLDNHLLINAMSSCEALIFPSVWYEGMPVTILEAFASKTPVIASNLGAMKSMIEDNYNGLHFEPGNAEDLAHKVILWASFSKEQKQKIGQNAHQSYIQQYTPEKNKALLIDIYNKAINNKLS